MGVGGYGSGFGWVVTDPSSLAFLSIVKLSKGKGGVGVTTYPEGVEPNEEPMDPIPTKRPPEILSFLGVRVEHNCEKERTHRSSCVSRRTPTSR